MNKLYYMNNIGEGIQEIKDCKYCQQIINKNFEEWEVKAKEAQEKAKESEFCEHLGTFTRNFYDRHRDLIYELKAEGGNYREFCTDSNCIPASGVPNKVIFASNGFGDEWRDNNHVCQNINIPNHSSSNDNCDKCHQDMTRRQLNNEEKKLNLVT